MLDLSLIGALMAMHLNTAIKKGKLGNGKT